MSKTMKLALTLMLLVGMLAFSAMTASAETLPFPTASIVVTLLQDNGGTSFSNFQGEYGLSSSAISVKTSSGETLDQALDYNVSINGNVVTISNLLFTDTYYVSFSSYVGGQTATAVVFAKVGIITNTKLIWSAKNNYTAAKSGVIAGTTVGANGAVLPRVTVKAFNKNTIYETTSSDVYGSYKLFVPAGKYTLVIVGKDTVTTDYANVSKPITVVAGQAAGPMLDLNGQTPWSSMGYDSQIGLTDLTISGSSKTVTGTAYKGANVSIYEYNCPKNGNEIDLGDGTLGYPVLYWFVGSTKVTAAANATTGTFSITLPEYPAGKKYAVRVVDSSLNPSWDIYKDWTYVSATVPKITAGLGSSSTATIITPVTITETEPSGVTVGNFNKNVTSVVYEVYGNSPVTLNPSQYSLKTPGKLIINKGVLATAQTYTITISATGYNNASVTQIVSPSTTMPPANLTGTFTVKPGGGSVSGSAQFSAIGTAGSGNSLAYVVSSQSTIQVKLGNPLTGHTALAATTDITGVSVPSTKYIHVYEISSTNAVVKARVFTLTAEQIKS